MGGRGTDITHTTSKRFLIKSDIEKRPREFKTHGSIDGIKVVSRDHGATALPRVAGTSDAYFAKNPKTGAIEQLRIYDKNKNPLFDIDIESRHGANFSTHVHPWINAHFERPTRLEPEPFSSAKIPNRFRIAVSHAIEENKRTLKERTPMN